MGEYDVILLSSCISKLSLVVKNDNTEIFSVYVEKIFKNI